MGIELELVVIEGIAFVSVVLFVMVGVWIFSRGWEGYEEKYLKEAHRTLESMFLVIPVQNLIYLSIFCMIGVTLLVGFIVNMAVGVVLGLPSFFLPIIGVRILKRKRAEKFVVQLVDALNSISNSLKAGFSLPQAMELIVREMPPPISQEFRICLREMRLGATLEDSLNNLLVRMPSEDLDIVVTAIVISRELGGDLSEVLEKIAHTIRERFRIEGKIKALTAQGKLQAIIVSLMPLALGLAINAINPELMKPLYETLAGWGMMVGILGLIVVGYLWIRKIVTIEV